MLTWPNGNCGKERVNSTNRFNGINRANGIKHMPVTNISNSTHTNVGGANNGFKVIARIQQ